MKTAISDNITWLTTLVAIGNDKSVTICFHFVEEDRNSRSSVDGDPKLFKINYSHKIDHRKTSSDTCSQQDSQVIVAENISSFFLLTEITQTSDRPIDVMLSVTF